MSTYPWYELVDAAAGIEQGDFLFDYPVPVVPEEIIIADREAEGPTDLQIDVNTHRLIVMTQSCDLQKLPVEAEILLCPTIDYSAAVASRGNIGGQGGWNSMKSGRFIGLHLLDRCELDGIRLDYQVVDLQKVFTSPLRVVRVHLRRQGNRVRPCPPYREHLAQAFARQFMRVGLPSDLPQTVPQT
jgi:hypothetical protein